MKYADRACTYTEDATHYIYSGLCIKTKKQQTVKIPKVELFAYRQGGLIQDAMPSVSRDDAEFLMSGYSAEGWNLQFPEEE